MPLRAAWRVRPAIGTREARIVGCSLGGLVWRGRPGIRAACARGLPPSETADTVAAAYGGATYGVRRCGFGIGRRGGGATVSEPG